MDRAAAVLDKLGRKSPTGIAPASYGLIPLKRLRRFRIPLMRLPAKTC